MKTEQAFQLIALNLSRQTGQSLSAGIAGAVSTKGMLQRDFNQAFSAWRSMGDLTQLKQLLPVLKTYGVLNDLEYERVNQALEEK